MAKQVNLNKFGAAGERSYKFTNVINSTTNFSSVNPKLLLLSGFDGGIDEFGTGYAPRRPGRVLMDMWLLANDEEEMTNLRDEISQLVFWGVRELFMTPYNDSQPERWCYARCVSIDMPEDANIVPEMAQKVSLDFEVSSPLWFSRKDLVWIGDPLLTLDPSGSWEVRGERFSQSVVGLDTFEINYLGKAPTPIKISFNYEGVPWLIGDIGILIGNIDLLVGGFDSIGNLALKQYTPDNILLESWYWGNEITTNGERFIVDSGNLSITKYSSIGEVSGWKDFSIIVGNGFMQLLPGLNKFKLSGSLHKGKIEITYDEAWTS